MISPDVSYAVGAALASANLGSFFAGKRHGRSQAQADTNEAQSLTIEAQSARIDLLEKERDELKAALDQLRIKLDYLEELVLRGATQMVQAGTVANK